MVNSKFPGVLAAVEAVDKSQLKIGKALAEETDDNGGKRSLKACAEELEERGYPFKVSYLGHLKSTHIAFPANRRHDLPWSVHEDAGDPDTLDSIVKGAKKAGEKVTKWYVRAVLKVRREQDEREKQKIRKAAADARAKEEAAERTTRASKSDKERSDALKDQQKATKERQEAEAAEKKIPPKGRPKLVAENTSELAVLGAMMSKIGGGKRMVADATKLIPKLTRCDKDEVAALAVMVRQVSEEWRDLAEAMEKAVKASHLVAVG